MISTQKHSYPSNVVEEALEYLRSNSDGSNSNYWVSKVDIKPFYQSVRYLGYRGYRVQPVLAFDVK